MLLILFLISNTIVWFYLRYRKKRRKRIELENRLSSEKEIIRLKQFRFYVEKMGDIKIANDIFLSFLDIDKGYFSNYQLSTWKNQHVSLFNDIISNPYENIDLHPDDLSTIYRFIKYFYKANQLRDDYNRRFLEEELKLYNSFFDKIEGRKLDIQQRTAIVTDEDNNLVIAGAGTGKTTTIVGKVNYLIDRYQIAPSEILLISFTRKSASILAKRVEIEGLAAKTFHKLGKDIIAECEGKQPNIFDENQFNHLLTNYFNELLKNEPYLKLVILFFTDFLKPIKSQFEFENQGEYIQYLKDNNFRAYRKYSDPAKCKTTYHMEVVKSVEECRIANFLLFNGIEYMYECPYEYDTADVNYRQYKPDFTIKHNYQQVYLEHFALSRNGSIPKFFAKQGESYAQAKNRYWEKINWARALHSTKKTTLIETYSYEMSEGILFDNLTKHLNELGIPLRPKSPQEIWLIINDVTKYEVNSIITLIGTFITLMKSNNYSINAIIDTNSQFEDGFLKKRNNIMFDIIKPIYELYVNYLSEREELDFSDMINKATQYIATGVYKYLASSGKHNIKYVYL